MRLWTDLCLAMVQSPSKVIFVASRDVSHPQAGGSEVTVDRLAAELTARGNEVVVLCGGLVGERPYEVVSIGGTFSQYFHAPITYWCHHRDADVVVDVSDGLPFFAPLWRRGATVLLVDHVHGRQRLPAPVAALGSFVERCLVARLYRRHQVVAVSESTRQGLIALGVKPSQVSVANNGIDVPDKTVAESPEPTFVFLGRLVPHKRVELILDVWQRVGAHVGGRLVIAGDGPERDRLQGLAGPAVIFAGDITPEAKHRLLGQAWLLVVASEHEGWGLEVMEAAAEGTASDPRSTCRGSAARSRTASPASLCGTRRKWPMPGARWFSIATGATIWRSRPVAGRARDDVEPDHRRPLARRRGRAGQPVKTPDAPMTGAGGHRPWGVLGGLGRAMRSRLPVTHFDSMRPLPGSH